jgi:uncharacterized protein
MKQNNYQGFLLSILYIFLLYFFTRSYFSLFSWFILGILLILAFLKEENRLFAWVMISYFGGSLILFYSDKFIEVFQLKPFNRVIINQLLFIIPILSMCYVIKKFDTKISYFCRMPESVGRKNLLHFIWILISVGFILIFITHDIEMDMKLFLSLFLFAIIHAGLQEVFWRGILLTQVTKITNDTSAILFTSIGFAINTTIFGFSTAVFLLYLCLGFLFAFLTTTYKSILPAIFAHTLVLIMFFLQGWLQLPI